MILRILTGCRIARMKVFSRIDNICSMSPPHSPSFVLQSPESPSGQDPGALLMVLSDIFSSLAMVGMAGQHTPSRLALPRRYRYTAMARLGRSL